MSNAVQTYINEELSVTNRTEDLFRKICTIIDDGRRYARTAINLSEVYAKYEIGRYIVEIKQQ